MNRDSYRPGLIRYCSCNSLTDPPCGIGAEFISFAVVEFLHGFNKTQVSFLDQVKEKHSTANIPFRDTYNETEIGFCQTLLRLFIPLLHTLRELDLFVCGKKTDF